MSLADSLRKACVFRGNLHAKRETKEGAEKIDPTLDINRTTTRSVLLRNTQPLIPQAQEHSNHNTAKSNTAH
jgi:hypothetical protein